MKWILFLLIQLALAMPGNASVPSAISIQEVLKEIGVAPLSFKDEDFVFGYQSLKSCLHERQDVSMLKHYCSPVGHYPARGYTIMSAHFGVIYIYEEILGPMVMREISIEIFPEDLARYSSGPYQYGKIAEWNKLFDAFYLTDHASCWSTNYSPYTKEPESGCFQQDISQFPDWSNETMNIVNDPLAWDQLIKKLDDSLSQGGEN